MDTIQHIKKGTQYPAVMITTGLNDPRVAPWEPAKVAAALQASGTSKPVLLRIDEEAGHGIGSTKTQTDDLRPIPSRSCSGVRGCRSGSRPLNPSDNGKPCGTGFELPVEGIGTWRS